MPWQVEEKFTLECENSLRMKLPDGYRKSMMQENGGDVSCDGDIWKLHPIWDKSDRKRLKRTSNDVVRETKAMKEWAGWPDAAICIAANGSGDALLFLTENGACNPTVFRWNHETGHTIPVADEFSDLARA